MDAALRKLVRDRAADRCEYCHLPQQAVDATFHVEHIRARQHGGTDTAENLALACDRCNLFKGPNLVSVDPVTQQVVLLFHPRNDDWNEHFVVRGSLIEGQTPTGRSTVELLQMNAWRRRKLREAIAAETARDSGHD